VIVWALATPAVCLAWQAKVVDVPYADHLQVLVDGKKEMVRLYGIDSPIDPQPYGKEAKLYTIKRCLGKMVEVEPIIRDHYDRIIAWVDIDGENLNKEFLRKGLTWWYQKYLPFEVELGRLEEEARNAKVGLWADSAPIPPWEYQPVPAGEHAGPQTQYSHGRRGIVREKISSELGRSKRIVGDEGSVRKRLMELKQPEQVEKHQKERSAERSH
jgi:endonuclease YncB( thermonuclease family)